MRNALLSILIVVATACIACARDGNIKLQKKSVDATSGQAKAEPKGGAVYVSKEQMDQVFVKGGVIYKAPEMKFQVHAGRKSAAGQAEVHAKDTDIFYILEGTATLVTGGTLVGAKETAPDETRGASITGGESRLLSKGDMVIIPNGTPHLLTPLEGTFLYYVVKTR